MGKKLGEELELKKLLATLLHCLICHFQIIPNAVKGRESAFLEWWVVLSAPTGCGLGKLDFIELTKRPVRYVMMPNIVPFFSEGSFSVQQLSQN